jgi:chemotaxis protein histidine kinase CheA
MLSDMSDEFLNVATKEINEDLTELKKILAICENDANVIANADKLQKHTHKIKGLAPMMGKVPLGEISGSLDTLLKKYLDGGAIEGIFDLLSEILPFMTSLMTEDTCDFLMVKKKISEIENMSN